MGGLFSSGPRLPSHVMAAVPYMCKAIESEKDSEYKIRSDIVLKTRRSVIKSIFTDGLEYGLFAATDIPKNTCFVESDTPVSYRINDQVDLTPIMTSSNDDEMYEAWKLVSSSYYELENLKSKVNVIMVYIRSLDRTFMCALRPINAGEELVRCYGFTTWLGDLNLIRDHFTGYCKFFNEFVQTMGEDPMIEEVFKRHEELREMYGVVETGETENDVFLL